MGVNVKTAEELTGISLTMSAGVLPVIVKLLPVLGGVQTHIHTLTISLAGQMPIFLLFFFFLFLALVKKLPAALTNASLWCFKSRNLFFFFIPGDSLFLSLSVFLFFSHSHNTEVAETCENASSSLLHNHFVNVSPSQITDLGKYT